MTRAEEITADSFMDDEPLTVSSDTSVSSVKNTMEEHSVRAVPVVNSKNQLKGVIGYRDLIRHMQFNPEKTKLEKMYHQAPEFEAEDNLVELCDLRINSGRKMLVMTDRHDHLEGVIGDREFAEALHRADEVEDTSTGRLATDDVMSTFEEDSIERARHRMLDENISRLPVLDKDGKLTGILRSTDVLRALVPRESQHAGGAAGNRDGGEVKISGGGEKDSMADIPVKEIMASEVNTSSEHMSGKEAIEQMLDREALEIVFMEGGYPDQIITLKDFIQHVAGFAPGSTILVSLVGLEMPEEKAAVQNQVKKQLQGSIGRKIERPEELRIHVKKAEKDGRKHRYELNFKLYSEHGMQNVESEAWDLMEAVDEGLEELDAKLRREKGKKADH